jgi:amino-acid N-acetyltransferase
LSRSVSIRPASTDDFADLTDLIRESGLETSGLRPGMPDLFVAVSDGRMVGCAALEIDGAFGLLRSVAVVPNRRGEGIGDRLVHHAHSRAADLKLDAIYLLTTTAEHYFPRFGYRTVDETVPPDVVTSSAEYSTCVAADAALMKRNLSSHEHTP